MIFRSGSLGFLTHTVQMKQFELDTLDTHLYGFLTHTVQMKPLKVSGADLITVKFLTHTVQMKPESLKKSPPGSGGS